MITLYGTNDIYLFSKHSIFLIVYLCTHGKKSVAQMRVDISVVVVVIAVFIILGLALGNLAVAAISIPLMALFFKIVTYVAGEGLLYFVFKNFGLVQIFLSI